MKLYRLGILTATLILAQTVVVANDLLSTPVIEQNIPNTLQFNGVVEAINQGTMSAQTEGQVVEILYDVNDAVAEGSLLIRLKDNQQQANLARAKATRHESEALLSAARQAFNRSKDLFSKKLLPKSDLDKAEASLKATLARLDAAKAGLLQAEEQLSYTRLHAPYSGIVTQRHIEIGEVAHPGQPLISGLSLNQLRVNVDLPQSLITSIKQHDSAVVQLQDGRQIKPTGLTLFPYADSASNTIKVRLRLPEKTRHLLPGMFVKTFFTIGERSVLTVPFSTLVQRSELTALYIVAEDGQITLRQVSIGERLGTLTVLLSGITAGEQVAIDPVAAGIALKQQANHDD